MSILVEYKWISIRIELADAYIVVEVCITFPLIEPNRQAHQWDGVHLCEVSYILPS